MNNQNFPQWLLSTAEKKPKFVGGATFTAGIFAVYKYLCSRMPSFSLDGLRQALNNPDAHVFLGILAAIHALTCVLLVWATPRPMSAKKDTAEPGAPITREAYSRIQRMVLYLYSSLALLYTIYAFFLFKNLKVPMQHWGQVFETLTAILIFFLYVELSQVTVNDRVQLESKTASTPKILRSTDAYRHKISFSVLAMILIILSVLSFLYPSATAQSDDVQVIIRFIVASLSSVTLALVIGRLGSMYINPGTVTLSLLYFYASIQVFAALFNERLFLFVLTTLAMPLKILLWLVFIWAFTTRKLWEYLQEVRDIVEKQDEIQQQI